MATARPHHSGASAGPLPLLERRLELEVLDAAIARAGAGHGGAVVVEGPAGIGKTALLLAACARAAGADLRVMRAAGRELERDFPFGVARQLFEEPLAGADGARRAELLAGAAAPAAVLLGAVPATPPPADAAPALMHALYWLAGNLAEDRPLLLVVDDLQWADDDSLRALSYVLARSDELSVLLVAAMLPGDDRSGVEGLAGAAAAVLRPRPLGPAATASVVRAVVADAADDAFCDACHRATGGNPFLARELALAAAAEGVVAGDPGVTRIAELAPATVARATLPRIRRLGTDARALGRAVAVLGRAQLRVAAELAGLDEDAAAAAADALAEAGILAAGWPLRFEHPVVATVVLDDAGPASRARAHRRAAELLHAAGAGAELVASHLMRTEPRDEPWAAGALRAAASRAQAGGSPETAARLLQRAVDEGAGPPAADLLLELAQAEAACGSPAATERLARALALAPDPAGRARVLATLAETRFVAGDLDAAVDAFRQGLDEAERRPGSELEIQLFLGYAMLGRAYRPTARDAHERIDRRLTGAGGQALGETARLAARAYDGFLRGEDAGRVRELAAAALADTRLLDAGGSAAQAFYLTTWALAGADGFDEAEAALERAFERAAGSGSQLAYALACHHRLWSRWRRGAIPLALADAEVALELAGRGWQLIRPAVGWARCECLLETGDVDGASEAIAAVERLEPGLGGSCVEAWPLMGRSRLELERGDPAAALAAAVRCGSLLSALAAENPAVAAWRSRGALAAAAGGDGSLARELWQEELRLARAFGAPRAIGIALRAGAVVEGGERGLDLLREAVAVLDGTPAALERARSLADLGAALRRARRPREAREPLRRSLDLALACGAGAVAAFAHDELRAAGARPRRQAVSGPDALTPRELQVALLAADGLGNREIAQALFITRKTAESHLRGIFRKLGIGARDQIRDALDRRS